MNFKNFSYSIVATPPSPALSGTSIVLATGGGALMPSAPFAATIWPSGALPLATNAELVHVTARVGDTVTIQRAKQGSLARAIIAGDQFAATISAGELPVSVTSVAALPAYPVNGQLAIVSTADGPILLSYDEPTLKWVSAPERFPINQGNNLSASYITVGGAFLQGVKAKQDAGLKIQTRFVLTFFQNNTNSRTISVRIVLYEQADGDTAGGTVRYTSAAATKLQAINQVTWWSSPWDATAMTALTKPDGYLTMEAKETIGDGNIVLPGSYAPWNSQTAFTHAMYVRWAT